MLSMSGTVFSKLLRGAKPSMKYPHVSISFDRDLSTLYSFGRQNLRKPWIAGFVEEHPNTGVFDKFDTKCEVFEVEVTDEQYNHLVYLVSEFKKNIKEYKYNFSGLVFTYLKIPKHLNNKFTCTQFVAWVLTNSDIQIIDKPTSLIISNDYYNMPNSKVIFKGCLKKYAIV